MKSFPFLNDNSAFERLNKMGLRTRPIVTINLILESRLSKDGIVKLYLKTRVSLFNPRKRPQIITL